MTKRLCPDTATAPAWKRASVNAGVREPSAPKNTRPNPSMAKCTATETISSTSTDALASGW